MSGAPLIRMLGEFGSSRSSESISTTAGAGPVSGRRRYSVTVAAAAAVVSTTAGPVSASTALTRSSCEPGWGTDSGTAISPAWIAARNATM